MFTENTGACLALLAIPSPSLPSLAGSMAVEVRLQDSPTALEQVE